MFWWVLHLIVTVDIGLQLSFFSHLCQILKSVMLALCDDFGFISSSSVFLKEFVSSHNVWHHCVIRFVSSLMYTFGRMSRARSLFGGKVFYNKFSFFNICKGIQIPFIVCVSFGSCVFFKLSSSSKLIYMLAWCCSS